MFKASTQHSGGILRTHVLKWLQKPKSKKELRGQQSPQDNPKECQRLERASTHSFPSANAVGRTGCFHHSHFRLTSMLAIAVSCTSKIRTSTDLQQQLERQKDPVIDGIDK
jgi:hypothetical protein